MRSRTRLSCSLLGVALACAHAPAARASNDGKLCDGWGIVMCVPLFAAAGVAHAFEPKNLYVELHQALAHRNLDRAKRAVLAADPAQRAAILNWTVDGYLMTRDDADAVRLALILFLLDDVRVDLSGAANGAVLQTVVKALALPDAPGGDPHARQLAVARLLVAHGARAETVALGECSECNAEPGFLALLLQAGAGIDTVRTGVPLYGRMVQNGNLAAAERLLALGADPNGNDAAGNGLLYRLARGCDLRPKQSAPSAASDAWLRRCVSDALVSARFAIAHGADPNGRTTWEHAKCETPYAVAVKMQNTALADALRDLGADPAFSARCLAAAPRQP